VQSLFQEESFKVLTNVVWVFDFINNPQFEVFENFTSKGRICSDFCEKISKLEKPLIPVFSSSERACSFYERKNHGFSRQFFDYLYWPCLPRQGYCV